MPEKKAKPGLNDLESIIKDGVGADTGGFTAQTSNGSAHWRGTGWNWHPPWTNEEVPVSPTHPPGRSNRTGE
jgi:hypothetical protein